MSGLIFDRTKEDVDAALEIRARYQTLGDWTGLTAEETAQLERGTYTAVTLNRVAEKVAELVTTLQENGYSITAHIPAYIGSNTFTESDVKNYLATVAAVRAAFPASESTPEAPDITRWIDYEAANDIERLLWEVSHTIEGAKAIMRVSGAFAAGDDYIMQIIRRG